VTYLGHPGISLSEILGEIHPYKRPPTPLVPPSVVPLVDSWGSDTGSDVLEVGHIPLTHCSHSMSTENRATLHLHQTQAETRRETRTQTERWFGSRYRCSLSSSPAVNVRSVTSSRVDHSLIAHTPLRRGYLGARLVEGCLSTYAKLSPVLSWALVASSLSYATLRSFAKPRLPSQKLLRTTLLSSLRFATQFAMEECWAWLTSPCSLASLSSPPPVLHSLSFGIRKSGHPVDPG
jgi:hypothetical protein